MKSSELAKKEYLKMGFSVEDALELVECEKTIAQDIEKKYKTFKKNKSDLATVNIKILLPEGFYHELRKVARIKKLSLPEILEIISC